ncbi:hypothetical protein KR032_012222 [Drosophila birchii]|nr:hypothetical protein KR032_012222 [Drosophila birchii]
MWGLILAFLSLSAVCCQSELFRDNIRTPENMDYWNRLLEEKRQRQEQGHQQGPEVVNTPAVQVIPSVQQSEQHPVPLPTLPPLQSPSLVSAIASQSDPVITRFGTSAIKQPYPVSSGLGATHVDLATSEQISRSVLQFAYILGQHLGQRKTEIFSPLSIVHSLAMLYLGARGRSYEELASVFETTDTNKLHQQFGLMLRDVQQPTLDQVTSGRPQTNWRATSPMRVNRKSQRPGAHEVHMANGLFTATGFTLNPDYRQVLSELYGAELDVQDFEGSPAASKRYINSWVAQHTRGHIENIIANEIPHSTRMLLANALYFRGFWETDFMESATRPDNFYPNGEGTQPVRVQLMATGGTFPYYEDELLGCRIIGLPYRGNLTTMYIIQPLKSSTVELMALQKLLSPEKIEELISRMYRRSAIVAIPKMHLTESVNLKTMMQNMRLGGIFSSVQNDLSLIASQEPRTSGRGRAATTNSLGGNSLQNLEAQRWAPGGARSDLFIDDIIHKVDFNVNEQGTEAAAATVTFLKKSGPEVIFRVDTPFMVLVRHDPTKLMLFYGLINEPPASN